MCIIETIVPLKISRLLGGLIYTLEKAVLKNIPEMEGELEERIGDTSLEHLKGFITFCLGDLL